jgi:PAS domain S-box-containing protein
MQIQQNSFILIADEDRQTSIGLAASYPHLLPQTESDKASEPNFRQIIDSSPALIHTGRPDGYLDFFNRTWLDFIGQPLESLLGWKWTSHIHPEDVETFVKNWRKSIATGEPFEEAARVRRADGEYRWMLHRHLALRDDDARIVKWNGSSVEIQRRKQAEEQLPGSIQELERGAFYLAEAQRLQSTLNVIPAHAWYALSSGGLTFLNKEAGDYGGLPKDHPLRSGIDTHAAWDSHIFFLHPDDHEETRRVWSTCLRTGRAGEVSFRVRNAEGEYRWFLSRAEPLRASDGTLLYWIGVNHDIDDAKRAEQALQRSEAELRRSEKELREVIDTIPTMAWSALPDGSNAYVNKRFVEYSGLAAEQAAGSGWQVAIHPDDLQQHLSKWMTSVATGKPHESEVRFRRADGQYRWHLDRGVPLRDEVGNIVKWYGVVTDIEERKQAEFYLAKASRLTTVAELSASIAHELNQPLMSVLANAQAGKRWLAANPPNLRETNASVERIIRDVRAADQVMQHIRGLFKQESFKKKQASIRDVVSEAVRFLHGDPRKHGVSIDWQLDEHLPTVSVDLTQVQQVFINLISNAMEALEGSQISPHIIVRASATAQNQMLIQVIDNGPGVADQERIFDAFVTTKKNGMGIGLAVSRSIVEAHGGRLWAENNPGGGATFNVALPVSPVIQTFAVS